MNEVRIDARQPLDLSPEISDVQPHTMSMRHLHITGIAVVLIVGTWLSLASWGQLRSQFSARSWPVVQGTVFQASTDNDESNMPQVIYEYTVNNTTYTDTTSLNAPGFGNKRKRWEYAEEVLKQYPEGATVPVHVNPSDPRESVLKTMVGFDVYVQLSVGMCLMAGGLFWLFRLLW